MNRTKQKPNQRGDPCDRHYRKSVLPQISKEYISYLRAHGKRENEIKQRKKYVDQFLKDLYSGGLTQMGDLNGKRIYEIIENKEISFWFSVSLRAFLKYLYLYSYTAENYTDTIPVHSTHKTVPSVYTPDEMQRFLASIDRTKPSGVRDYALIILIRTYALRAGDVAKLKIDDIDFIHKKIRVITEKTGNSISFNLTEEVEKAITEYIYSARPKKKDKHLFLNKNYPHRPMSNSRIYHIVSGYFKSADINIEGKRHGPHSIRASRATELLDLGASVSEVSAFLTHTTSISTMKYLQVSIEHLMKCSIPVPVIKVQPLNELLGGNDNA